MSEDRHEMMARVRASIEELKAQEAALDESSADGYDDLWDWPPPDPDPDDDDVDVMEM